MSGHPFAGFNPKPSPWGYNWASDETPRAPEPIKQRDAPTQVANHYPQSSSPEPQMMANQLANMPAALLNSMKREKKPFTYTPGGVNLNEVLNARLQKRIERKKKYSEERMVEDLPRFDPPKQVMVMPTHNTPLDMYSMENALEVLEMQAALVANNKSLSSSRSATLPRNQTFRFEDKDMDPVRGVTQSNSFKVLQIITDTDEEPSSGKGRDQHRDEMRFSGIRESKAIPSKFFHTLQKITGTEDDDDEQEDHHQQQQYRQMQRVAAPQPAMFEKQTQMARPPQQQQNFQQPASNTRVVSQMAAQQQQSNNVPGLKRPAAFLPIKTTPGCGFRPVQPSFLANGSPRRVANQPAATDF